MSSSLNPIAVMSGLASVGMEMFSGADRCSPIPARPVIGGDVVLEAGMTFALEPNCHLEDRRINIGGSVLLTEKGPVELNTIANNVVQA